MRAQDVLISADEIGVKLPFSERSKEMKSEEQKGCSCTGFQI